MEYARVCGRAIRRRCGHTRSFQQDTAGIVRKGEDGSEKKPASPFYSLFIPSKLVYHHLNLPYSPSTLVTSRSIFASFLLRRNPVKWEVGIVLTLKRSRCAASRSFKQTPVVYQVIRYILSAAF